MAGDEWFAPAASAIRTLTGIVLPLSDALAWSYSGMIVGGGHNGWFGFTGLVQRLCNARLFVLVLLQFLHSEL